MKSVIDVRRDEREHVLERFGRLVWRQGVACIKAIAGAKARVGTRVRLMRPVELYRARLC